MKKIKHLKITLLFLLLISSALNLVKAQPKPTAAQLAWHNMEFY